MFGRNENKLPSIHPERNIHFAYAYMTLRFINRGYNVDEAVKRTAEEIGQLISEDFNINDQLKRMAMEVALSDLLKSVDGQLNEMEV